MPSDQANGRRDLSRFLQRPLNVILAKVLPLSVYRLYLYGLGGYYCGVNGRMRRRVSAALIYILRGRVRWWAMPRLMWQTYRGIVEHYVEKMVNAHRPLAETVDWLNTAVAFSGRSILDAILARNMGCILVTGHFGAVEFLPLFLAAKGYRPSVVMRFKTQALRQALTLKSTVIDLELIDAGSTHALFRSLRSLKAGRVLITLCDEIHHWRPCRRQRGYLFGCPIPLDRTLDILYRRAGSPVCFGILRRAHGRYDLSIAPVAAGRRDASICQVVWRLLEHHIYLAPEQWYQWPSFYPDFTRYRYGQTGLEHPPEDVAGNRPVDRCRPVQAAHR